MSEWISIKDELPKDASLGVHDSFPVLILTCVAYSECERLGYDDNSVKITTWQNNRFLGFPAGATIVTHWMPLPELPRDEEQ